MKDLGQFPAERLAREVQDVLKEHVIDAWFPRCLDHEFGGFLCDFDRRWKPCGPNEKLLEFQARQTWLAAEASQFLAEDERLRDAVQQGFEYLRGKMWDEVNGGWFHCLNRAGKPIANETKHSHGIAYAISACVAVYRATRTPAALELAREGFEWLDRYARDSHHGGYFGYLHRDGAVFRDENAGMVSTDTLGTPIVCKDINVHSDLLESFTYLYEAWPDARAAERLVEAVDIVCNRMTAPIGAHYHFCLSDWTPVPHLTRYGYEFQSASRLIAASRLLGGHEQALHRAQGLVNHALRFGSDDPRGGFNYASPGLYPNHVAGHSLVVRTKFWWVQVEALKALLAVNGITPDGRRYQKKFRALWRYLQTYLIDPNFGGFYSASVEGIARWRFRVPHLVPPSMTRKGDKWKDASHEGRALLYCISALRNWKKRRGD